MDLQGQLSNLLEILVKNSKLFGSDMPIFGLTRENRYQTTVELAASGVIHVKLHKGWNSTPYGFSLYELKSGQVIGNISIGGVPYYLSEKGVAFPKLDLKRLYEEKPQVVEQAIQGYVKEIFTIVKDVKTDELYRYNEAKRTVGGRDTKGRFLNNY